MKIDGRGGFRFGVGRYIIDTWIIAVQQDSKHYQNTIEEIVRPDMLHFVPVFQQPYLSFLSAALFRCSGSAAASSTIFVTSWRKSAAFWEVITGLPVSASSVCRAIPATLPPRRAICWLAAKPCGCSVSATSVSRFLPSGAVIFNCTIFSYTSTAPSVFIFRFKSLQYRRGFSVPVSTEITSTMEKYHSSCSASHAVRICLSSNQIPRCEQRGIKLAILQSGGVFDPRGSRQISMRAWLLGSLLAGKTG